MPFSLPTPNASVVHNAQYFVHLSDKAYIKDLKANDDRLEDFRFIDSAPISGPDGINFAIAGRIDGALVIACRGSDDAEDWWHNFNFNQTGDYDGYVHRGFYTSANSIWTPLVRYLNATWEPDDTVWVTGHSLGGAIATLIARWLQKIDWEISGVYTFGQPRTGDEDYAAAYPLGDVHYRFVNDRDIVPQLPLPWMGPNVSYKHVGIPYKFDAAGDLQRGERGWSALSLDFARSMLTSGIGSASAGLVDFNFEDHRLKHYIEKIDAYLQR